MSSPPLDNPIFFLVHRLSRSLMRGSMAYYLKEFGLGVPQVQILQTLGAKDLRVSKDIADAIAMNKALVSRSLQDLMAQGYVESDGDPKDARLRIWRLTRKGRNIVKRYGPIGHRRRAELLKVLTKQEQKMFVDVLEKLFVSSEELRREEKQALDEAIAGPKAKPRLRRAAE